MKRLLLILIAGVLFFGCSKDNKTSGNTNLLIGRWYAVKDTVNTYVNNTLASQTTFSYHTDANYVQFNADGSGSQYISEVSPAYSETFTYTQGANNQITLNYPAQIVNGQQQPATSRTGTIKTLTESSLVVTFNTTQTINGSTQNSIEVQYFSIN
jgi:hypothetical protein